MTIEQFRLAIHEQPFQPFTIRMADGRTFEVPHPDFIAQSPSGRVVSVFKTDDTCSLLDLLLMTELEFHPSNRQSA
jgi:hypothetical protein